MHTRARLRRGAIGAAAAAGALVTFGAGGSVSAAPTDGNAYVIVDVQCTPSHDGVLDLTLTNDRDDRHASFIVAGPSEAPSVFSVAPLGARALSWTGLADGVVVVQIAIDGVDSTVARTVDCDVAPPRRVTPTSRRASSAGTEPEALPTTGGATTGLVIGSVLVAAGSAASLLARRRRNP